MSDNQSSTGKPCRVLLHMARQGEDWKGKAISFTHGCECRFTSLADLIAWLDLQEQPDSEEPA